MTLSSLQYYRSKLDPHDQAIYDDLFQHWMHLDDNFELKKTHCGLSVLTQALHFDNPILFYIDYYKIVYMKTPFSLRIKGGYLYSREEIQTYLNECEQWGGYIIKKLPSVGTAEKALWLHDTIISNVKYGNSGQTNAHNIIGVIHDKTAVCEGIAKTYKYLCDLADIPCIFVTGTLENEPHGWNMLWLCGGTSFVDVTNDIRNGGGYDRKHFLRNTKEMKGYQWDTSLIPECKVYNAGNAFFTVHNEEELLNVIKQNMTKDSLSISLQFRQPADNAGFQRLINHCFLRYPPLLTKKISYSSTSQFLYIDN